ncbi:hypothetical protein WR25_21451 [Diploscapter pachys]|uniref:tRNA-dihydrouridine(16/17) synthase [NAD(P)(+)] n=1 Tax=Diploscapter pachys TaxID=2018661 RepID=A0A2A2JEK2_9BILA|nr:hypothetical protein WR25_21451 [Diploscapter pachys]
MSTSGTSLRGIVQKRRVDGTTTDRRNERSLSTDKQDDVELLSNWIMHYKDKATIELIVDGWLQAFRNAPTSVQRIGLFYVMNDVVQKAKHKNLDFLIPAFQPAVLSAVQIGRTDAQVTQAMRRCIDIFTERRVFTQATVSTMINFLMSDDNQEAEACVELDTEDVYKKIEAFAKTREIIQRGVETVSKADFNYRKEITNRMKDKKEGAVLLDEVSDAVQQVVDFRHAMETQKRKMLELIEVTELARRVFASQLKEVTIVEDAYQKFGQGIREVSNELKEMKRTGIYPAATPPRDAPSPTANDDIYATGVEAALNSLRPAGSRDVHEMADMEIGDEEEMMEDELLNLVTQHASNSVKQFVDKRNEQSRLPQQPQQHMQIPQHHQMLYAPQSRDQSHQNPAQVNPQTPVQQHRAYASASDPRLASSASASASSSSHSMQSSGPLPVNLSPFPTPVTPQQSHLPAPPIPPNMSLPPPAFVQAAFSLPPPGITQPRLYTQTQPGHADANSNGYRPSVSQLHPQMSHDEAMESSSYANEGGMDSAEDYARAYAAANSEEDYHSYGGNLQNRRYSQPNGGYYDKNHSAQAAGGNYNRDRDNRAIVVAACAVGSEGITEEEVMAMEINEAATVLNSREGDIEAEDRADAITIRQRIEMTTTQGDGMEEKLIEMEYDSAKEKMFAIEKEHGIERLPKRIEPPEPYNCSQEEIEAKRRFWKDKLKELNITKIVAPMVDQSELPFRMMMRKHGAQLTFTPMIHAHLFVSNGTYRRYSLSYFHEDRPLIVQFCANKPETFLAACRLVEGVCDGVDLNLGCPQMVAKRGHYGAFLQDEVDLICSMVSSVRDHCKLPVSCKIRIRDDPKQTIEYACRLVQAGASMLTVHGRTREMKGQNTGLADWSRIKQVIDAMDVPVLANGNIQMPGDVERCIAETGCAGVMSAEGILSNPYLFEDRTEDAWKAAKEYLEFAKQYPPILSEARSHIFRICHHAVMENPELRDKLVRSHTLPEFEETIDELRKMTEAIMETEEGKQSRKEADEMFRQIRDGQIVMDPVAVCRLAHWIVRPYMRPKEVPRELVAKQGEATYRVQRKNELKAMAKDAGVSIRLKSLIVTKI